MGNSTVLRVSHGRVKSPLWRAAAPGVPRPARRSGNSTTAEIKMPAAIPPMAMGTGFGQNEYYATPDDYWSFMDTIVNRMAAAL